MGRHRKSKSNPFFGRTGWAALICLALIGPLFGLFTTTGCRSKEKGAGAETSMAPTASAMAPATPLPGVTPPSGGTETGGASPAPMPGTTPTP